MVDVAAGVVTFGLGGDNNALIGFPFGISVEIIVGSPAVGPGSPASGSPSIGLGSPGILPNIIGGAGVGAPPRGSASNNPHPHSIFPDRTKEEEENLRTILIRVKHKDKKIEKIYIVSKERAEFIIKVLKIFNKTRARIKITASNFKRKTFGVIAKIKDIGKKKDK